MESTRLRELTQEVSRQIWRLVAGRNGENPIKGIDTLYLRKDLALIWHVEMEYPIKGIDTISMYRDIYDLQNRRNGEYPIKGIDTYNTPWGSW